MASYEIFKAVYAANFHRLTDADGEEFWNEFVSTCDGEILKDAIERLAEVAAINKNSGRQTTSPKLAEVKAQYYSMKRQYEEKRRNAAIGPSTCGFCEGNGAVIVIMHDNRLVDFRRPPVASYPAISWYVHPCRCSIGYLNVSEQDCSMQSRIAAVKCSIPWQMKDGDRIISGQEVAWNIVWDCNRRYIEKTKQENSNQKMLEAS